MFYFIERLPNEGSANSLRSHLTSEGTTGGEKRRETLASERRKGYGGGRVKLCKARFNILY